MGEFQRFAFFASDDGEREARRSAQNGRLLFARERGVNGAAHGAQVSLDNLRARACAHGQNVQRGSLAVVGAFITRNVRPQRLHDAAVRRQSSRGDERLEHIFERRELAESCGRGEFAETGGGNHRALGFGQVEHVDGLDDGILDDLIARENQTE